MSSLLFAYFSPGAGVGGREEEAGGGGGQDGYLVPRGCRHEKGLPRVFLFLVHFTDFSKVYNTRLFMQYSDHVPVVYFRTPPFSTTVTCETQLVCLLSLPFFVVTVLFLLTL